MGSFAAGVHGGVLRTSGHAELVSRLSRGTPEAHTLVYDAAMKGDFTIPATAATVHVPTLVLDGATTGWIINTADALARVLPEGRRRTFAGQQHNVEPGAVAPPLAEFFAA